MLTENDSQSEMLLEMNDMIETMYLTLVKKRYALGELKKSKSDQADEKEVEIENLQATFDGICKTHSTYLKFKKQSGVSASPAKQKESLEELRKVIQDMKSSTMGQIVSTVPRT